MSRVLVGERGDRNGCATPGVPRHAGNDVEQRRTTPAGRRDDRTTSSYATIAPMPFSRDSIVGCIVGGAVGDLLGGVAERGGLSLSDDTQLTLATCEALSSSTRTVSPEAIAATFREWFRAGSLSGLGSSTLKALRDLAALPGETHEIRRSPPRPGGARPGRRRHRYDRLHRRAGRGSPSRLFHSPARAQRPTRSGRRHRPGRSIRRVVPGPLAGGAVTKRLR